MPDLDSDRLLWDSFLEGSNESLEKIYRTYFDELYNYGYKWIKEQTFVEDTIQDLFIKLMKNRSSLSSTNSPKFYLFRSFRSVALDKMAVQKKHVIMDEPSDHIFPLEVTPEHHLLQKEEQEKVRTNINNALLQITPRQREALYLRYVEGFSYEQISELMELSPKATYKLMARALSAIKSQLNGAISLILLDKLLDGNLF